MNYLLCPNCNTPVKIWKNPAPTADVIIYSPERGIVLIKRGRPPYGWALPGGFVEIGETVEATAVREAREETGLEITLTALLGIYSDPARDPRRHTMTTVFMAEATHFDTLRSGDDAADVAFHPLDALPPLAFDHARILEDFRAVLAGNRRAADVTLSPA